MERSENSTFSAEMCVFGTEIVIHVHVGMGDVLIPIMSLRLKGLSGSLTS